MNRTRVRYAPSPTGIPHVGNIRTALFDYLFAKNQSGQFILRIEDTDQNRLVPESLEKIKQSLELLNLKWDEEYQQSKRLDTYQKYLNILKEKGLTYEDEGAYRFKVEKGKKLKWHDVVHNDVEFQSDVIEDFIIMKSDGYPTYHFASVVDDHDMDISHVLRGDEWISSTPKHLLVYEAFGWEVPQFVHLPPILGSGHKKLSKRDGAKSVLEYIDEGYLPEALVNFLAFLGWAPLPPPPTSQGASSDSSEVKVKEKEIYTMDELIKEFTLDRINKNSPVFNLEKLNWFNKKHIQLLSDAELIDRIKSNPSLQNVILSDSEGSHKKDSSALPQNDKLSKIIPLLRDRLTTLADFPKYASIFFQKGRQKPPEKEKAQNAKVAIESIDDWTEESITTHLDKWIKDNKLEPSDFKNTLRLAVFADNTPPIYQSLAVLTKEEVLKRIEEVIKYQP